MSQHRASFTSSRFVAPAAVTESAPTVFSTQTGWEPDNTALNSTEIGSADPSTGGYDYFASNYGSAESYHHSELHTPGPEGVTEVISTDAVPVTRRGGAHRIPTPPTALKGRAAVLAVAAGAVVAAGQAVIDHSPSTATSSEEVALAAGAANQVHLPHQASSPRPFRRPHRPPKTPRRMSRLLPHLRFSTSRTRST